MAVAAVELDQQLLLVYYYHHVLWVVVVDFFLLLCWGGLRFGDAQRCRHSSLSLQRGAQSLAFSHTYR